MSVYSADIYCANHKSCTTLNNEGAVEKKTVQALALAELVFSYGEQTINHEQINKKEQLNWLSVFQKEEEEKRA